MKSNNFAINAVPEGEGDGGGTHRCVQREQGFGVGSLLAADGVENAVRPESQTGDGPASGQPHVRAKARRWIYSYQPPGGEAPRTGGRLHDGE